jgi:type VI protein secretion system component VasK
VAIAVIVVVLLVVVAIGVALWRRRRADPAVVAARQEISAQRKALKEAEKTRNQALSGALRGLKTTTKAHEQKVNAAQRRLAEARDPKGKMLGSYHGVRLYERWIDTPHGSGQVRDTVASVDAQISSRITATRLVTLGVFALAAKKKTGAIFLSIDNPGLASVIECSKDENLKARQFAVKITNAGKQAATLKERMPAQIAAAEQSLEKTRGDTAAVDEAQAELTRLEQDEKLLAPVRAAQEVLVAAEAKLAALTATPIGEVASAQED